MLVRRAGGHLLRSSTVARTESGRRRDLREGGRRRRNVQGRLNRRVRKKAINRSLAITSSSNRSLDISSSDVGGSAPTWDFITHVAMVVVEVVLVRKQPTTSSVRRNNNFFFNFLGISRGTVLRVLGWMGWGWWVLGWVGWGWGVGLFSIFSLLFFPVAWVFVLVVPCPALSVVSLLDGSEVAFDDVERKGDGGGDRGIEGHSQDARGRVAVHTFGRRVGSRGSMEVQGHNFPILRKYVAQHVFADHANTVEKESRPPGPRLGHGGHQLTEMGVDFREHGGVWGVDQHNAAVLVGGNVEGWMGLAEFARELVGNPELGSGELLVLGSFRVEKKFVSRQIRAVLRDVRFQLRSMCGRHWGGRIAVGMAFSLRHWFALQAT